MARRRVSLHGLWQQAGIGESFLRRRDEIQAASSTTNKLHCSCSGCERVPSTSVVTRPSICLFATRQAPRILPVPQCFFTPTSTAASPTPDPCSGLGHCQRVSTPLPWTCSKTNNYQACSFVGVGIFDFSNLTCTLLAAGCGEEGTSTSSSAIARLSLDLALSAPITI